MDLDTDLGPGGDHDPVHVLVCALPDPPRRCYSCSPVRKEWRVSKVGSLVRAPGRQSSGQEPRTAGGQAGRENEWRAVGREGGKGRR